METTKEYIGEIITSMANKFDADLLAISAEEIAAEWYWSWEENQSIEWNTYKFSDIMELHKRR